MGYGLCIMLHHNSSTQSALFVFSSQTYKCLISLIVSSTHGIDEDVEGYWTQKHEQMFLIQGLTLLRVRAQLMRACVGQGFSREVGAEVIPGRSVVCWRFRLVYRLSAVTYR